ncbi:Translation initiation factor IF-2 [Desulfovibrionales bacterium]
MTTDRIRIKELAIELAVSTKDLIQALREMGIEAKSQMSSMNDIEANDLKARFRGETVATKVDRQEIQPGQIVRRRRHPTLAAPIVTLAPKIPIIEASETPITEIVAQPSHAQQLEPEPEPQMSLTRIMVHSGEYVTPITDAPYTAATPDDEDADPHTPKRRKKKKEVIIGPQVRVISMPEPDAAQPTTRPAYDSFRPTGQRTSSPRPGSPTGQRTSSPRPGSPTGQRTSSPRPGSPTGQRTSSPRPGSPTGQRTSSPRPGSPGRPMPTPSIIENRERIRDTNPFIESAEVARRRRIAGGTNTVAGKGRRMVDFTPALSEEEERRRTSLNIKKRKGCNHSCEPEHDVFGTQPMKAAKRKIRVEEYIRVADLAHQMGIKAQAIIKMLFDLGTLATINHALDIVSATMVAAKFGYEVEKSGFSEVDALALAEPDIPESLKPRPPVVTIMGHVDHGKTSLLDSIRKTKVALNEAGGITQHIGAYHVMTRHGEIVFLDTPGHEAFTAMRARGAQITDIVVLVVAADDGVMEQTREAVNHSRAADVPIVVAVNKIDKEGADPDRVKRELSDLGLLPEDWGGDTIFTHVSAKKHIGLNELLEMILLQAEVLDLKANPNKPARGRVIEARLDKGRGSMATLLVQEGTLCQGDNVVCGLFSGRVRALFNDQGKKVKGAGPATPVEVQGLEGVPEAGDEFSVIKDEKLARRIATGRQTKEREKTLAKKAKVTLETFLKSSPDKKTETKNLNLVLKADVQGSLEAVADALIKLSTDEVKVKIIHAGAGAISESDTMLAAASEAIVIGFNVRPAANVKEIAASEGVEIRFYDIIYKLVNDIKDAMSGMLSPTVREIYLGQAEVRQTFSIPKAGTIAGCYMADGKITRAAEIRLLRNGVVTYNGRVSSLKRFKEDAKEVLKGFECGIGLDKFTDMKIGDIIEAFESIEEARIL